MPSGGVVGVACDKHNYRGKAAVEGWRCVRQAHSWHKDYQLLSGEYYSLFLTFHAV